MRPGTKDAAVLVPLYLDSGALHAVFTKRRDDLKRHAGEISFPGGRQDFPDEDLRTTALREAEEEIGLAPADVELVGALEPVGTFVTNYKIHPFVGVIKPGHAWTPQPTEVEEVLELSLPDLVARVRVPAAVRRRACRSRRPPTPSAATSSGARPPGSSSTSWAAWPRSS